MSKKKYLNIDNDYFIKVCMESRSMRQASQILNIPYTSFARIAKRLNCYKTNQGLKGLKRENNRILKYKLNDEYFKKWTPQMSYWLGFITADGSIHNDVFSIDLSIKDKEHLQHFLNDIESDDIVREYIHKNKQKDGSYKEYKAVHFKTRNKIFINSLRDNGIEENKTYIDRNYIQNVPEEFKPYFIIGYFDGNGCVERNGYISISGNKICVLSVFEYLNFNESDLRIKYHKNFIECIIRSKKDCFKFWKLYLECSNKIYCLERKKNKILDAYNKYTINH